MTGANRSGLGEFLRSRRARLSPEAVGLAQVGRRRTAGLRREEVAELAGIGIDWYVRLEQGRAVTPSANTIDALARALRLNRVEHEHLRTLARDPGRRTFTREQVPDPIRRMVERLAQPAYVTGRRWDVLAWSAPATETFADFGGMPEPDRNILVWLLLDPAARALFAESWPALAQRVVAQFRAAHDVWSGDPAFAELLARLRAASPEFPAWWENHEVRSPEAGTKVLHHPTLGRLCFEHATFQANDDPALKLTVYTAVPNR